MCSSQIDHEDNPAAISSRESISHAIDVTVKPEPRLGITLIGDVGHKIEIRGSSKRNAMLGYIHPVLVRIELDFHRN